MTSRARRQPTAAQHEDRNAVHLSGRVSGTPVERELPSGDRTVTLRVVVTRSPTSGAGRAAGPVRNGGPPRVDTFDVTCWSARTRASALRLPEGQQIEVEGPLRRRFYRTPVGPSSRYEVHASRLRRL